MDPNILNIKMSQYYVCIMQHVSNICAKFMKKISNTEAELKKRFYKKSL